ncbi:D-alanyl-D-alanine carboxypeptidase family protein [Enterovirga aerilata]|uniref:D-alanyl-D-alanine carboxypeptidase n=1 Tax=Enterovirga aerilata TaxID=2730920 RepID=A0A849IKG6_9HYPH|nr:D-alanyl-D-alanine carboxypeptidase family protein [Enterovirga sp. DB1703]NNM74433.1 D-alanyl-D-alanine carboxypeptidase [Enterovirga sp. DB1703]
MARRAVLLLAAALALFGASAAEAGTPALVVDAASGRVLYADRATDPWYPASVTKLMTAYVALDLVRQGKFSMNSLLTMSPEATREPPSKMGFKPGTQLTLENALRIIMVKSANDVSMMIGENLAGSVENYAALMNEASRRLGMRESRWYNQNGLPDERQQTSARDMAILARALIHEFPEHEDLFRIGALKLGRKIIRNHNGMLGRYPGADGMKTGFICMGGFNIVATATQNGRRLIAVVMGYPSARERDLRAADLFDHGFASSGWAMQTVDQLPPSPLMSPPNMRSVICGPNKRQPQEDDETAVVAAAPGGNADNPIASLFSPSTFSVASAGAARSLGGRTSLGPRVEFEPVPIWLGATPGTVADEDGKTKAKPVAIAAKPVQSKRVRGRNLEPVAAAASLTPPVAGTNPGEGAAVTTLRSGPSPASRSALSGNLQAKPAADAKPKLGAVGAGAKAKPGHGQIRAKPALPAAALDGVELRRDAKAKPRPVAKPARRPETAASASEKRAAAQ